MSVRFYNLQDVKDEDLKIAAIVSKYQGKLVLCKHKDRDTWEVPGGHREGAEAILDTAKRELYEETGAKEFMVRPICAYCVSQFAMLYYAEITEFGGLPESEMEKVGFFEKLPDNLTYPWIHPELVEKALSAIERA